MRAKTKTILALIIIAIAIFTIYPNIKNMPFFIGWSTLSITSTTDTFRSSFAPLNSPVWVLTVAQGGLAQYADGTILGSTIVDPIDKKKAGKGFTLRLDNTRQRCSYPIYANLNEDNFPKIRQYELVTWSCVIAPVETEARQQCAGKVLPTDFQSYNKSGFTCYSICYYPTSSLNGNLKTVADYAFDTTFGLTVEGQQPVSGTINSAGTRSVLLPSTNPVAYAEWVGNFTTGDSCPDPVSKNVSALFLGEGRWTLIDKSNYGFYVDEVKRLPSIANLNNITNIQSQINTINLKAQQVNNSIDNLNFYSDGGQPAQMFGSTLDSGKAQIELEKQFQIPVFTLYVKADTLGIVTLIAKPEIVSALGTTFKTGETGYLNVSVKNVGEEGSINVWTECGAGVSQIGSSFNYTYAKGETKTISIPITGTASATTTVSCIIYAQNVALEKVSRTVSVTISPQQVCTPLQKLCIDNKINQCDSQGLKYNVLRDCAAEGKNCGYNSQTGEIDCVTGVQPPVCGNGKCEFLETNITCPQDCGGGPSCGNGVCDFLEGSPTWSCPKDCAGYCGDGYCNAFYETMLQSEVGGQKQLCLKDCYDARTACLAKQGDGIFVLGYEWEEGLLGIGGTCKTVFNLPLIVLIVVGGIAGTVVLFVLLTKRKR